MKRYIIGLLTILLLTGCNISNENKSTAWGEPHYYKNYNYNKKLKDSDVEFLKDVVTNGSAVNLVYKDHLTESYERRGKEEIKTANTTHINVYDDNEEANRYFIHTQFSKFEQKVTINNEMITDGYSYLLDEWDAGNGYRFEVMWDSALGNNEIRHYAEPIKTSFKNKAERLTEVADWKSFNIQDGNFYKYEKDKYVYVYSNVIKASTKVEENGKKLTHKSTFKTQRYCIFSYSGAILHRYTYDEVTSNRDSVTNEWYDNETILYYHYEQADYSYASDGIKPKKKINEINEQYSKTYFYTSESNAYVSELEVQKSEDTYTDPKLTLNDFDAEIVPLYMKDHNYYYKSELNIPHLLYRSYYNAYVAKISLNYIRPTDTSVKYKVSGQLTNFISLLQQHEDFVIFNNSYGDCFVNENGEKDCKINITYKIRDDLLGVDVVSLELK